MAGTSTATAGIKTSQQASQSMSKLFEPLFNNAKPLVEAVLKFLDVAGPYGEAATRFLQQLWIKLQPYDPQSLLPLLLGIMLIFFGGQFPITIAAIEAFRICGWENTKRAILILYQQYKVAMDASRKDDMVDENKDGIADVKQIRAHELVSRKIAVFLRSTDPTAVNEGVGGLAAGLSAVVATLRLQFAQTITLGISLGDIFSRAADQVLRPALEKTLPREYHRWSALLISYACRSLAVTIAWWCQRVISALHSAMRGAQLVLQGVAGLAKKYNVRLPVDLTPNNPVFPAACSAIGGIGMYTQLMRGFALPFPFNILLVPVRLLEWALYYILAYGTK